MSANHSRRVPLIMIESGGISEDLRQWLTNAVARIVECLGLEQVMFEAAHRAVFSCYI